MVILSLVLAWGCAIALLVYALVAAAGHADADAERWARTVSSGNHDRLAS
jgi:hypothetical protein